VVGIEEVYGVSFEDDEFDIEVFKTVRSIADFVRKKTGKP
jgi:acyl carrier protein